MERPVYQLLPPLTDEEYAALKADIQERGVQVAVEFDEVGNVLDGHHRLRACQELGIEDFPRLVRRGMTEQEKRRHVRALNLNRRHLSREQRRELIGAELIDDPNRSNRQIAEALNVDHKTVGSVREGLESIGEIPQLENLQTANGRTYPTERRPVATPATASRFDLEAEVERVTEALLREVVPPALEKALSQPLPEAPTPRQPAPSPTYNLAAEPPMMQAVNLSLSVERLAKHPLSAADFKKHAQPYTLQRVREQAPAVIRLLQEIEKD